jgi:hypothetical protein
MTTCNALRKRNQSLELKALRDRYWFAANLSIRNVINLSSLSPHTLTALLVNLNLDEDFLPLKRSIDRSDASPVKVVINGEAAPISRRIWRRSEPFSLR